MSRFYTTSTPEFIDGNIYAPPAEMMSQLINIHEDRTDNLIKNTEFYEGIVDSIQHLNFDAENERVRNIQDGYRERLNELTDRIYKNPLEYQRYSGDIRKLQRDIQNDRTSGDWYHIEQRQKAVQNWMEENKDMAKSSPDEYNAMLSHYMKDLEDRATGDVSARFSGDRVIGRPDLIGDYQKYFENMKAKSEQTSDGKYIYNNKILTEAEIARTAWHTLMADPKYRGYANQMGKTLGISGYLEEDGSDVSAFLDVDKDGNPVTYESLQNMTDEEKAQISLVLNPNYAFYHDLASISGNFRQYEREMKVDQYGLEHQKQQDRLILESIKHENALDKLEKEYELKGARDRENMLNDLRLAIAEGGKKGQAANKILNELALGEVYATIPNPESSRNYDATTLSQAFPNMTFEEIEHLIGQGGVDPNSEAFKAFDRLNRANNFILDSFGNKEYQLRLEDGMYNPESGEPNSTMVSQKDYLEWLGGRPHDKDMLHQYLENKGVYQGPMKSEFSFVGNLMKTTKEGIKMIGDVHPNAVVPVDEALREMYPDLTDSEFKQYRESLIEKHGEYFVRDDVHNNSPEMKEFRSRRQAGMRNDDRMGRVWSGATRSPVGDFIYETNQMMKQYNKDVENFYSKENNSHIVNTPAIPITDLVGKRAFKNSILSGPLSKNLEFYSPDGKNLIPHVFEGDSKRKKSKSEKEREKIQDRLRMEDPILLYIYGANNQPSGVIARFNDGEEVHIYPNVGDSAMQNTFNELAQRGIEDRNKTTDYLNNEKNKKLRQLNSTLSSSPIINQDGYTYKITKYPSGGVTWSVETEQFQNSEGLIENRHYLRGPGTAIRLPDGSGGKVRNMNENETLIIEGNQELLDIMERYGLELNLQNSKN